MSSPAPVSFQAHKMSPAGFKYPDRIFGAHYVIERDGTIYQAVDGKGEIMVLNPLTGSYYVTLGVDDFEEALTPSNDYEHINIGSTCIDFTDSQGKASPQIGIA